MLIPTTIVLSFICWNGVDLYAFLRSPFFFNPNCYMLSPLLFVTIRIMSPSRIQRYVFSHVLACTSLSCSHRSDSRQLLTPSKKDKKENLLGHLYFCLCCCFLSVVGLPSVVWKLYRSFALKCFFLSFDAAFVRNPLPGRLRNRCGYQWLRGASILLLCRCLYSLSSLSTLLRGFESIVGCRSLVALGWSLIFIYGNVPRDGLFLRVYYSHYSFVASSIWDLLVVAFRCAILMRGLVPAP